MYILYAPHTPNVDQGKRFQPGPGAKLGSNINDQVLEAVDQAKIFGYFCADKNGGAGFGNKMLNQRKDVGHFFRFYLQETNVKFMYSVKQATVYEVTFDVSQNFLHSLLDLAI